MPITKSAQKSLAVALRRRDENAHRKGQLKDALHRVTRERVGEVFSIIDRAAVKGVIHANKAARLKSRLAKKFGSGPRATKSIREKQEKKRKSAPRRHTRK